MHFLHDRTKSEHNFSALDERRLLSYGYLSIYHGIKGKEDAMGLIKMYQEKLGDTEGQAENRAILCVVLALVSVGFAVLFLVTFPYQETRTEKIQLLPGNHTWVRELPTREFPPVAITYEQDFLRLVGGKETLVSADEIYIIYEVMEGGKPFQSANIMRDPSSAILTGVGQKIRRYAMGY